MDEKKKKVGCLVGLGCAGMLLAIAIFGVFVTTIVMESFKSSDAYKGAMERARADADVVSVTGEPIDDGLFVSGRMNVTGSTGDADFGIPISGPDGEGTVYVVATKSAGVWAYDKLVFETEDGNRLDLLD